MLLLINNRKLMGKYVNGRVYNYLAWGTTVAMTLLTVVQVVTSIFPGLMK
jgi:Mn2+/Fe2+ NRAMP family transporter